MAGEWVTETGGKVEPGLELSKDPHRNAPNSKRSVLLELCSIPEAALSQSLRQTRGSRAKHELIMTSENA